MVLTQKKVEGKLEGVDLYRKGKDMQKTQRTFTREFKVEAVQLARSSQKDVDLWTCQDDSWFLPWLGKAEDRSIGAIERDIWLLFLCHTWKVHQRRQWRSTLPTFP